MKEQLRKCSLIVVAVLAIGVFGCGKGIAPPSAKAGINKGNGKAPSGPPEGATGSNSDGRPDTAAAKTVEELGRKVFDAIKWDDLAGYLDTAMPEHAAEHIIAAYQSMVDNESDPEKKQKAIGEFEECKSYIRSHLGSLKGEFEKKWKTEIIGKATGLGIEWENAELVDVITKGEKPMRYSGQVLPGIVRHADMAIKFRCRGKSFTLLMDDPTKINGNWYFFDPLKSIRR